MVVVVVVVVGGAGVVLDLMDNTHALSSSDSFGLLISGREVVS